MSLLRRTMFSQDYKPPALCTNGVENSLLIWNNESLAELKNKGGDLKKIQLIAVSYLFEILHDVLLAKSDNVSSSPGFEMLGLRVNNDSFTNGKRKRNDS